MTKCYRCEDVTCVDGVTCHFQIQGMDYDKLPRNIPTVSDTPWAVGGSHRNDFSSAERICVMVSGQKCIGPHKVD